MHQEPQIGRRPASSLRYYIPAERNRQNRPIYPVVKRFHSGDWERERRMRRRRRHDKFARAHARQENNHDGWPLFISGNFAQTCFTRKRKKKRRRARWFTRWSDLRVRLDVVCGSETRASEYCVNCLKIVLYIPSHIVGASDWRLNFRQLNQSKMLNRYKYRISN